MFWREGEYGREMARNKERTNKLIEWEMITGDAVKRINLRICFGNFLLDFERARQKKEIEINIRTDEILRLSLGLTWIGTAYCSLPELHFEL